MTDAHAIANPRRERRRAVGRLLQKIQHAVPALVLLQHGYEGVSHGAHGWHLLLSIAQVLVAVTVIVAVVVAIRTLRRQMAGGRLPHLHLGIDWLDIFLAGMLFVEVWTRYHDVGRIPRPTLLLAVIMLIVGVYGGRFAAWKRARRTGATRS
jgi:hypothetical protein